MNMKFGFENQGVYKKYIDLINRIYKASDKFPNEGGSS
jgi:hypothetical protein